MENNNSYSYRLVIGENGNGQGHIIAIKAHDIVEAKKALKKALLPYNGEGWGRIELFVEDCGWDRVTMY